MDKHEYKGAMPICMFKDTTGIYCHLPRRHEIHDMRVPDSPAHPGVSARADVPIDTQETIDTNHKLKQIGDSASIVFRATNIEEIRQESEKILTNAEVIEKQNEIQDYAVETICKDGRSWTDQREDICKLINLYRKNQEILRAQEQGLRLLRAQRDVDFQAGFTNEERAEFEKTARRMEKVGKHKLTKVVVDKPTVGTKAQFIKDQLKTGLFTIEEAEAMWDKVQAKKAAQALSPTDKPKSVTNIAGAASSMEKHGLSKEQVERIMKGKKS